jgi:MoCo/4Fe-4S cofactor protein with predicted Tat translocation signal
MDFAAIRSRLASNEGRLYWRSLGELADTLEFRDYLHREFPEQASEWNDPKGRRNFLKLMSASLALAGVGACTRQPAEQIVPYVRQPEDLVPGRPLFFASAIPLGGIAKPVLVESHMGRPTKIEGNPEHPASLGATDLLTQGAVLGLYDPDRSQTVTYRGEVRPWGAFLSAMQSVLGAQKASQGAGIRFLTEPITSPSLAELIATVLQDYPQATWHQYDPIARDGARMGLRQATGGAADAVYHLDKADVIVSLDADFLGCGPASIRYTRDFNDRRRVTESNTSMNRLYVVESSPTLTGAKAEHRLPLRASDIEGFARSLASAIGVSASAPSPEPGAPSPDSSTGSGPSRASSSDEEQKWVAALAKDLQAHRGSCVVMAGDFQPASLHALAHAMNQALGNVGATVTYAGALEPMPVDQHASLADLASAMDGGQVQLLVILGNNPVYTAPADLKFGERITKVGLVVYHGLYQDETANVSHWNIPDTHPLESWGDPRAYDGTVTIMQPLIAPLYDGRSAYEVLGAFTTQPGRRTLEIVKDYWTRAFPGPVWTVRNAQGESFSNAEAFWKEAVHDGFIRGTATSAGGPATPFKPAPKPPAPPPAAAPAGTGAAAAPAAAGAAAAPAATPAQPAASPPTQSPELRAPSPDPSTGSGSSRAPSSAPRVPGLELRAPSPESRAASGGLEIIFRPDATIWDGRFANNGWLQETPKPLTKLTWDTAAWISPKLAEERNLDKGDVIELRYRGLTARLPVFVVPGQPDQSVTVFFGYGRRLAGRVGNANTDSQSFNAYLLRTSDAPWFGSGLEIAKTGDRYLLATTQEHHAMEGRYPARVATLEQYTHEPAVIKHMGGHTPPKTLTLYPDTEYTGYKWGMAIDLTSCTGCAACVVACTAENNIPVVGKEQVNRNREMHWIRVDHYFTGDISRPELVQAVHQPVPCQQCENAPCEVVCPVAATTHSSEGLNDMVYNRCVGTRYCSNNCPYKVRRFNFLLYQDWYTESYYPMRNPDVTVRSRGVMEKCTYCVQRINQARIDAKREDRDIRDGDIVTACEAVCPADAIVFGNLNDPNSRVSKLKTQERNYGVLEDLNTRPRTSYLAALRNTNPELEPAGTGERSTTKH